MVTAFISGIVKLLIGGYLLAIFVPISVRATWDKEVRNELFSYPHRRNEPLLMKVVYAAQLAVLLAFGGMIVYSGVMDLAKLF